jgi:putative oxidoreductase
MNVAYTLGRVFIPIIFLVTGIQKALNIADFARILTAYIAIPDEIAVYLTYIGNPPRYEALGYLIAAIEIVCALMVLAGLKARWAALVLIVFTACSIIFAYPFWEMTDVAAQSAARADALRLLSILGGLLLIVAVGPNLAPVDRR